MPNLKDFYSSVTNDTSNLRATYAFQAVFSFDSTADANSPFYAALLGNQTLVDSLKYHVQDIAFPEMGIGGGMVGFEASVEVSTFAGSFRTPGQTGIKARSEVITINYLDTDVCLHEKFFMPWMEEVVGARDNRWVSRKFPFSRADIRVDVFSTISPALASAAPSAEISPILTYLVMGAYPVLIDSPKFKYGPENNNISRAVNFEFNNARVMPFSANGGSRISLSQISVGK